MNTFIVHTKYAHVLKASDNNNYHHTTFTPYGHAYAYANSPSLHLIHTRAILFCMAFRPFFAHHLLCWWMVAVYTQSVEFTTLLAFLRKLEIIFKRSSVPNVVRCGHSHTRRTAYDSFKWRTSNE